MNPTAARPNEILGRVGKYELLALIGKGGMGCVYKAKQVGLDRLVAIKMILNADIATPEDRRRFQTEARAAASLDHPGIVAIHDIGEYDDQPYFSMDYVDGPTLAHVIRESPIPPREAVELAHQVAQALAHAHASGVLHRDLKPSNILLDQGGHPRITDFGLAKRLQDDSELTRSGQVLGTPNYMSPEQAAGRLSKVGPESDIYGLGAVLYAALTGSPPFQGASLSDVLRRVVEDLPTPPRALNRDVDRDLEAICLKCLEKRIGDRYASATQLADDLDRYLRGDPVTARPRSYARDFYHWSRRPQRVAQAGFIILIIAAFYGLCAVVAWCLLIFRWVPITNPAEAALIATLDSLGFVLSLAVGLGILARKIWLIGGGLLLGLGIVGMVLGLLGSGFSGGGLMSDPFVRISMYSIFGFVGVVVCGTCSVALLSQREHSIQDAISDTRHLTPVTPQRRENLATTLPQSKS